MEDDTALSPPEAKRQKLESENENTTADSIPDSAAKESPARNEHAEVNTDSVPQNLELTGDREMKDTHLTVTDKTVSVSVDSTKLIYENKDQTENSKEVKEHLPDTTSNAGLQLSETDVGIIEYISKHEGFHGVLKQRYSDFLVNEISKNGDLVQFTHTDLPHALPEKQQDGKDVSGIIDAENIVKLSELRAGKDTSKSVLIQVGDDKDARARIHQAVSEGFPGLDSTTVTKDDNKYIEVKITTNQGNGLRKWPKGRGDYCQFVLYKENKDTMDAIGLIAKQLRVKSGLFQYAGTKDRRAKTSQEITVYRMAAEKLKNNNNRLRNIAAGNFRYVNEPLKLGQLQGNKFTVVLRSVTGSTNQIEEGMTSLRDVGFINYYGMQRFGTMSIPTHHIGRALLQSNWKEAVELILKPRAGDDKGVAAARKYWWETRNSRETINKFPRYCAIERTLLQGLVDGGENNYVGALNKLARNTRLMYVHSYQSYVWNTVVSHRVQSHGLSPVSGDLVIRRDALSDSCDMEGETITAHGKDKPKPTQVDDTNISSYTIYDVVLPLPGYDVIYPEGDLKTLYKDLMSKDDLDCDSMRHKTKDYSLSGDYRHMLVKPRDVSWTMYRYNDVSKPLALSDWERLHDDPVPENIQDGAHLALKLELTLPTSCYATMAIREILKTDTSPAHQSTLNIT